jgi:hypothetical protein
MGKPNMLSWRADHRTSADDNSNITLLTLKLFVVHAREGLEFAGPELNILHDIHKGIKNPVEELIDKGAVWLRKSSTHSLHSREWSCKGNCRLASLRAETSRSGRGSEVSLLINRYRY